MTWGSVVEDEQGGTIVTDPKWPGNKSGDKDELPIRADLFALLKGWRERVPDCASDPVFPRAPHNRGWHVGRKDAGIAERDPRRGVVTPHSCRKSYITWLDALSIPRGLVTHLARHAGTLAEQSYIRHDDARARAAVESLPRLWDGGPKIFLKNRDISLANRPGATKIAPVTSEPSPVCLAPAQLEQTDVPVRNMGSDVTERPHGPGASVRSSCQRPESLDSATQKHGTR